MYLHLHLHTQLEALPTKKSKLSITDIFGHVQKNDSTVNYVSFTFVCFKTT